MGQRRQADCQRLGRYRGPTRRVFGRRIRLTKKDLTLRISDAAANITVLSHDPLTCQVSTVTGQDSGRRRLNTETLTLRSRLPP
jgi:hypothetical protein